MTRTTLRWILSLAMVAVGVSHFTAPEPFIEMMPPWFGAPRFWVHLSGGLEILGGLGLLVARARSFAGWGLVALYVAVFPANIYMATSGIQPFPDVIVTPAQAYGRLLLQPVLMLWAWWVSRADVAAVGTGLAGGDGDGGGGR